MPLNLGPCIFLDRMHLRSASAHAHCTMCYNHAVAQLLIRSIKQVMRPMPLQPDAECHVNFADGQKGIGTSDAQSLLVKAFHIINVCCKFDEAPVLFMSCSIPSTKLPHSTNPLLNTLWCHAHTFHSHTHSHINSDRFPLQSLTFHCFLPPAGSPSTRPPLPSPAAAVSRQHVHTPADARGW